MAQRKRKAPVQRQLRTWTIPRMLLILGYGVIFAFLGVIFLMRQELFRVGIFGDKQAVHTPIPKLTPPPQATTEPRPSAPSLPQVAKEAPRQAATPPSVTPPVPRQSGEITADEKQALDDILRSKR